MHCRRRFRGKSQLGRTTEHKGKGMNTIQSDFNQSSERLHNNWLYIDKRREKTFRVHTSVEESKSWSNYWHPPTNKLRKNCLFVFRLRHWDCREWRRQDKTGSTSSCILFSLLHCFLSIINSRLLLMLPLLFFLLILFFWYTQLTLRVHDNWECIDRENWFFFFFF